MKMRKRMAAMGLCLALMAGMLAGCGSESAPGLTLRLSMGQEAASCTPLPGSPGSSMRCTSA